MKQDNLPLIKFNPKLPRLSEGEKKVLKLFVEAAELIAPLYLEQEKDAKKVSREEIEKAAKNDSSLLSPYTVIEKINGELLATPYHIRYAKFLEPIAEKLNTASNITLNSGFKKALKLQAKALLDGSYEEAVIAWLKMKPYILDISIGPLNHFDDRLFFAKASYYAWVGVIDIEGTKRLNNYKSVILTTRRKAILPKERIDVNQVKARVVDVLAYAGLMARTKFTGINLPMDLKIVENYGTEIILFNQPNDVRMQEQIIPTFEKIFSPEFKKGFSREDLRRGYLRIVAMHEFAHSYLYYKHAEENLQDLFVCIYELAANMLGFRLAGSLLLKDRINNKQLESMIVAFICRYYYLNEERKTNKLMVNYGLAASLFMGFLFESGALKEFNGLIILNFTKVFLSIQELSFMLEDLLAHGTRKDGESFIMKYQK